MFTCHPPLWISGRPAHTYLVASPRPRILPEIDRIHASSHHYWVVFLIHGVLGSLMRSCHETPVLPRLRAM